MPAFVKSGSELLVNTTTVGIQDDCAVTALSNGRFVVTWTDPSATGGDTSGLAVRGQLYNADGSKVGGELLVNTTTENNQRESSVTDLSDGRFIVTWTDFAVQQGFESYGAAIHAQLYNADGSKSGGELLVNTTTSDDQRESSTTTLSDGRFVVTWTSSSGTVTPTPDDNIYAIRGQMFNADGTKHNAEFVVNTDTAELRDDSSVTALSNGRFLVTWTDHSESIGDTSNTAVRGQIYTADGARFGGELLINTTVAGFQRYSSATQLADGGFVVTWTNDGGNNPDIYGQLFAADGTKVAEEFVVNTTTFAIQQHSSVTTLADGGFVVTWSNWEGDITLDNDVYAQAYNADGSKNGGEFLINTSTERAQKISSISALPNGGFVVAWEGIGPGGFGNNSDIMAQVFNVGGQGVDLVDKPGRNSTLKGTSFDDSIDGVDGKDTLQGLGGADMLIGGKGVDKLYGGSGADTFAFATGDSGKKATKADTIFDFKGVDRIDLKGWDANSTEDDNQQFDYIGAASFSGAAGQLRFIKGNSDTWIEADTDGDGKKDFVIHLDDAVVLNEENFSL